MHHAPWLVDQMSCLSVEFFCVCRAGKCLPSSPHVGKSFAERFLLKRRCFGVEAVSRSTASMRFLPTT